MVWKLDLNEPFLFFNYYSKLQVLFSALAVW